MPQKRHGPTQLADLTSPVPYPVKRRGERRRRDPNWPGIAWLEAESLADTEITSVDEVDLETDGRHESVILLHAEGGCNARARGHFPRTMFQLIENEHSSALQMPVSPCVACYDFSRSWHCPDHPEVPWDGQWGWLRPGRTLPRAYASPQPGGMAEILTRQMETYANALTPNNRLNGFQERPMIDLSDFTITLHVQETVSTSVGGVVLTYEALQAEEGNDQHGQC